MFVYQLRAAMFNNLIYDKRGLLTSTGAQTGLLAQLVESMNRKFHNKCVLLLSATEFVLTEVPELPVRVTRTSSEVHR